VAGHPRGGGVEGGANSENQVVEEHGAFLGVVRGCEVGSRGDDVRVVRCVVDVFVVQMSLRTINTNIEIDPGSPVSTETDEFHGISVIYLAEGTCLGPKNERVLMLSDPGWGFYKPLGDRFQSG
jgi:hypothetical protein